ncbi:hypothetical protein RL74_02425 [Pseudomonas fluorescens]|uniref:Uncharacterized protein n=2 Tax=Pseudomonas TaxID=286 RepID=A0A0G3GI00_9PSED|nr:hypothetical protein VM99_19650 [Pseudomonas chlororaphis]KIQ60988.1 hypothetical protein RL74_02425 [Pseudomonas fluorescens]
MDPVNELCNDLMDLLEEIASSRNKLDVQGQKILLDALRSLLLSTERLSEQMRTLVSLQVRSGHQRPRLYIVE